MNEISIHSKNKDEYSDKYLDHAFEQYKLYLEFADRVSSRRQSANTFFLIISTALVTLAGYVKSATNAGIFFYVITSIAGIVICYTWYRLVLSYKNLNSIKFKVVHAIEKNLPFKLYDAEWEAVGRGKNKKLYHPFTNLEMRIPWIFASIHICVLLYIIPWAELLAKCKQP